MIDEPFKSSIRGRNTEEIPYIYREVCSCLSFERNTKVIEFYGSVLVVSNVIRDVLILYCCFTGAVLL